eukprot:90983_1
MFVATAIGLLWKIIMLSPLNISNEPCYISQAGTTCFYTIIRGSYYLFLTFRLQLSFDNSFVAVSEKKMQILRFIIIIGSLFICVWNIL